MVVPTLVYGVESWTPRNNDVNKFTVAEMRLLRMVKGYS